jgi:hypothetical protein
MPKILNFSALVAISSLTACASIPTGPSIMSLPGSGKSFEQFRYDDYYCRQFAQERVGGTTPNRAAISSSVTSAAIGAGVGAAAGAAIDGGHGAAIGAGTGLPGGEPYRHQYGQSVWTYAPATLRRGLYAVHVWQRPSRSGIWSNKQ